MQNNNLSISCQENGGDIIHYVFTYLLIYSAPSSPRRLSLSTVRYFPNLIIATWTPPIPKNGIITAYSVYCNTSVNSPIIGAKTNATTLVVTINTGSDMFTLYSCYVTANTSIGEGTPSQMTTIESRESHIKFITAVTAFFHIAIHFGDIYSYFVSIHSERERNFLDTQQLWHACDFYFLSVFWTANGRVSGRLLGTMASCLLALSISILFATV